MESEALVPALQLPPPLVLQEVPDDDLPPPLLRHALRPDGRAQFHPAPRNPPLRKNLALSLSEAQLLPALAVNLSFLVLHHSSDSGLSDQYDYEGRC